MQWCGILILLYGGFVTYLALAQNGFIFFPRTTTDERWTALIEELHADYVSIRTDDDEVLEGMFLSDGTKQPRPTVLFFGGNATQVQEFAHHFQRLRAEGINTLLIDYRGYGLSTGKPDAEMIKKDAEKIFDAATSHPYVDAQHITAWGYSLGTGVAVHLATLKPVERVMLFAPMTSMVDLAREAYPFVPVSLFLQHHFDTLTLAKARTQPVLIVHGKNDNQISPLHSKTIAEAWGGDDVTLLLAEGRGHQDLLEDEGVWNAVAEFLVSGF
jgi:uncharacterized protein